ncbi:hypothetical protein Tco_1187600 [Tanacetum coccineum]
MYGRNPITPLDLVHVLEVGRFSKEGADQSEQIKELHRSVQEQIIRHNEQHKEHADKHLSPYKGDSDDEPDWGSSLFQEGEDDADELEEEVVAQSNLFVLKDHDRIDESTNHENLGFDNLQIGCNWLHDVYTLACHRSCGF